MFLNHYSVYTSLSVKTFEFNFLFSLFQRKYLWLISFLPLYILLYSVFFIVHILSTNVGLVMTANGNIGLWTNQIGNILVCSAVYANKSMRTVTNIFIVNLAIADLLVIILCLPPTVIWDVTETWFLGEAMCKVILYFQVSQPIIILLNNFVAIIFIYTHVKCIHKFKQWLENHFCFSFQPKVN